MGGVKPASLSDKTKYDTAERLTLLGPIQNLALLLLLVKMVVLRCPPFLGLHLCNQLLYSAQNEKYMVMLG